MSHDELATHCYDCGRRGRDTAEQPLPDDWIRVYHAMHDDGPTGLACPACQTDEMIVEYMARMEEADALIAQAIRDEAIDETHGRPAGGRDPDIMMGIPPPDDD